MKHDLLESSKEKKIFGCYMEEDSSPSVKRLKTLFGNVNKARVVLKLTGKTLLRVDRKKCRTYLKSEDPSWERINIRMVP